MVSDVINAQEICHLRLKIEHLKKLTIRLSEDYKGLQGQYNNLHTRLHTKRDARHFILRPSHIHVDVQASLEKPSKICRQSHAKTSTKGGLAGLSNLVS